MQPAGLMMGRGDRWFWLSTSVMGASINASVIELLLMDRQSQTTMVTLLWAGNALCNTTVCFMHYSAFRSMVWMGTGYPSFQSLIQNYLWSS